VSVDNPSTSNVFDNKRRKHKEEGAQRFTCAHVSSTDHQTTEMYTDSLTLVIVPRQVANPKDRDTSSSGFIHAWKSQFTLALIEPNLDVAVLAIGIAGILFIIPFLFTSN